MLRQTDLLSTDWRRILTSFMRASYSRTLLPRLLSSAFVPPLGCGPSYKQVVTNGFQLYTSMEFTAAQRPVTQASAYCIYCLLITAGNNVVKHCYAMLMSKHKAFVNLWASYSVYYHRAISPQMTVEETAEMYAYATHMHPQVGRVVCVNCTCLQQ